MSLLTQADGQRLAVAVTITAVFAITGCAQKRGPNEPEPIDLIPGITSLEVDDAAVFIRRDLSRPMSVLRTRVNGVDFTQAQMRVGAALEVIDASGSSTYELVATERRHAIFKQQTVSGIALDGSGRYETDASQNTGGGTIHDYEQQGVSVSQRFIRVPEYKPLFPVGP